MELCQVDAKVAEDALEEQEHDLILAAIYLLDHKNAPQHPLNAVLEKMMPGGSH